MLKFCGVKKKQNAATRSKRTDTVKGKLPFIK